MIGNARFCFNYAAACTNFTGKTSTLFPIAALWTLYCFPRARVMYLSATGAQVKISSSLHSLASVSARLSTAALGDKTETKIKAGEKGKAELWRMIRNEVLFQHEYIANLPHKVKELIKFSTKGKDMTPADYDKLFAIAKKIEKMPAGQASDYASKVTAATTDLDAFGASLDKYIAEMAERGKEGEERDKIHTKLIGPRFEGCPARANKRTLSSIME